MKIHWLSFALLPGLVAGCQSADRSVPTDTFNSTPPPVAHLQWVATRHLPPAGPGDTLTALAQDLLRAHDLSPLWANADYGEPADQAMEGFYGPDYYRVAFYYDQVRQDSLHPEKFWVRGRNRYRTVITPFVGTITVRAIFKVQLGSANFQPADTVRAFVMRAYYELREDPDTKGAGVYRGEALLDVTNTPLGGVHQTDLNGSDYHQLANPNQGGGLTFVGNWTNNKTGRQCFAAWSPNLQRVTPASILEEQRVGGPTGDVDPILVKHGWNELQDNDEWWNASKQTARP